MFEGLNFEIDSRCVEDRAVCVTGDHLGRLSYFLKVELQISWPLGSVAETLSANVLLSLRNVFPQRSSLVVRCSEM